MKINRAIRVLFFLLFGLLSMVANAQVSSRPVSALTLINPWTDDQLIEPSVLVAVLKDGSATKPLIFNIGAVGDILGAKHIGAANNTENIERLKSTIAALPKNAAIVIYCGCCPFGKCPNIRPAFLELKKEGFTNIKVLNLTTNLKTDWIAKGYPLASK